MLQHQPEAPEPAKTPLTLAAVALPPAPFDIEWTETMRGTVVEGADGYDPSTAANAGRALRFTVNGTIESFDRFLTDDEHELALTGWVQCGLLGEGKREVRGGTLHLMRPTSSPAVFEMLYRLPIVGDDGRLELVGVKTVRDDRGFDLWADTSTLDVVLRRAPDDDPEGEPTEPFARGRLRISVPGFLTLFLGMRAAGGGPFTRRIWSHIMLRTRFTLWFLGRLFHVYGNPFRVGSSSTQIVVDRVGRGIRADREELGFMPRSRVLWTSPRTLLRTAAQVWSSTSLGGQLDVRRYELDGAELNTELAEGDEVWLDFVADTGDGFAATYSVAYSASRAELDVAGTRTQRGRALVLGGDLVYPTPTREDYEDRTRGPFEAAMPKDPDDRHIVFAIPGNHDWYDSLNGFQHYFMGRGQRLGGRRFVQRQSYFAAELPQRWWLLGVDIALDQRVDDRQIEFVRDVVGQMGDDGGAKVILVIAKPEWLADPMSRGARNLQFVEGLLPAGSLRLVLTGDLHHYARYETAADGPTRITCGGGGAYTASTHHLPSQLDPSWRPPDGVEAPSLQTQYPCRNASLRMRRGAIGAFLRRPSFIAAAGLLLLVLDALLLSGDATARISTIDRLRDASFGAAWGAAADGLAHAPLATLLFLLLAGGLVGLALAGRRRAGLGRALAAGIGHAALQLTAILATLWLLLRLDIHGVPDALVVGAGVVVIGGAVAALVLGLYCYVTDLIAMDPGLAFAVQSRTEFKSFLRLHVQPDGGLEVFAYGIPQVVKTWERTRLGGDTAPRLVPTGPLGGPGAESDAHDFALGEPPFVELIERVVVSSQPGLVDV